MAESSNPEPGLRGDSRIQATAISDRSRLNLSGRTDAFVVDLESFANGGIDKDGTPNSRIGMQRSFSRKGGEQEFVSSATSSPRVGQALGQAGCTTTVEKAAGQPTVVVAMGPTDPPDQTYVKTTSFPKSKWGRRYNSFKRSPPPYWFSDPKRVLLFFATLSSVGTILLIYFTLSMRKSYEDDTDLEW